MKHFLPTCIITALFLTAMFSSCSEDEQVILQGNYSEPDAQKQIVQTITTTTATGFGSIFDHMLTDSTLRANFVQAFSDPARYFDDNSGYIFVETTGGWSVAHPTDKSIPGTYRLEVQDIHGKFYHHDFVKTAKHIGYGFVEYYFNDPATGNIEKKLTSIKIIPGYDWFVASGFYGADESIYYSPQQVHEMIATQNVIVTAKGIGGVFDSNIADSMLRVEFCRNFIRDIRFFDDHSGYYFIYDFDANNIAHATQPELQGQNLYDYQDSKGNFVIRDLISIAKQMDHGYYNYYWNNPVTGNEEPKRAYVMKIPGTQYFIGSGIYLQ